MRLDMFGVEQPQHSKVHNCLLARSFSSKYGVVRVAHLIIDFCLTRQHFCEFAHFSARVTHNKQDLG